MTISKKITLIIIAIVVLAGIAWAIATRGTIGMDKDGHYKEFSGELSGFDKVNAQAIELRASEQARIDRDEKEIAQKIKEAKMATTTAKEKAAQKPIGVPATASRFNPL